MKRMLIALLVMAATLAATAQTVENIRVEQDGDKLNIHYRIGGSTSEQLYNVTLTCSIDGGPKFEPKSVIGDVGSNIRGGKSYNTIVWDVFEDVEEIGNVEFFVTVDLVKDESVKKEVPKVVESTGTEEMTVLERDPTEPDYSDYNFLVSYSGGSYHPLGVMVGSLKDWGWYGAFRYGGMYYDFYGYENYLLSLTGGVTKRIFESGKIRLYGYTGIGLGDLLDVFEFELGASLIIGKRFTVSLGGSYMGYYGDGILGLGVVF